MNEFKRCIKRATRIPPHAALSGKIGGEGKSEGKTGVKMELKAGEFPRVGSQTFWEQAGLENFVFGLRIYAPSERIKSPTHLVKS